MHFFYSFLITLATPFVLVYFALRGLRDHSYLGRWGERFGFIDADQARGSILVHAASVGEFNAARPLIKALLKNYPGIPLSVTTLTPTGSERVVRELGNTVLHSYIPMDTPAAVNRFLRRLQPRLVIVVETEIWPNLYLQSRKLGIPLLMASARLSKRSAERFQRLPGFVSGVLKAVRWVGAQSKADADRLIQAGAIAQNVDMTGNIKFDLAVPASLEERAEALRLRWGRERPVLVAGSTHEADENIVIPAFVALLDSLPDALLVLVPRYPERFTRATHLAEAAGLKTELHSQGEACSKGAQCFIIDSIGELMSYYACADLAFIGGSFGDQGGHNPLEPAALGKPVLMGPNMENAREIVEQLNQCKAARTVTGLHDFQQSAKQILTDGVLRDRMGQAGRTLVEKNKGAVKATLKAVDSLLAEATSQ